MKNAIVRESQPFVKDRNECIIQLLYDTGLRVGELVQLDVDMLRLEDEEPHLALPAEIQKDYPTDRSPQYREMVLMDETVTALDRYLSDRWKESAAVFPSKQKPRITTEGVRDVVTRASVAADVEPRTTGGSGSPEDVTPHVLRHSVAYRMLTVEDGNEYRDVRNRLRHARIATTEKYYDHFVRV